MFTLLLGRHFPQTPGSSSKEQPTPLSLLGEGAGGSGPGEAASGQAGRLGGETISPAATEASQWESLIGGKWALWVGSVAVFLAVGFFLAYAWQSLSNGGRLAIGFLAGLAFLGGGGWARGRAEQWFSEGLTGGGLAIQYLCIWAGAQRYGLLSYDLAFALMAATTALGVSLAVGYDAISLSALATLGGFLTPVLLRSTGGEGRALGFLTYVALLNAGILAISLFKRWQGIIWLSFAATFLLMMGWAGDSYHIDQRWLVFTFVSLYFLLFLGAACFYSLIRQEETKQEDLLLLFAVAFIYAGTGYALLQGALGDYPGIFPLSLCLFFALLALATRNLAPANPTLGPSAGGLALFFLTITIPIQLHQGWIAVGWSVEAAVLVTLGLQLRAPLLNQAGQVVWALALVSLAGVLLTIMPRLPILFVNERALPLLVSVLANGWMAVKARGENRESGASGAAGTAAAVDDLPSAYAAVAVLGGAWLIAQETYLWFNWHRVPSGTTWEAGALFVIAGLWAIYADGLFALGLRLRHPAIRSSALFVAGVAVVLPVVAGLVLPANTWVPFWNLRWLSYLVVGLMLALLGRLMAREMEELQPPETNAFGLLPIGISLLALCGMSIEIYSSFRWWTIPSPESWNSAALFALSILWSAFGVLLLSLGLAWAQVRLRSLGYAIGGAGIALLLVDSLSSSGLDWLPLANLRFFTFVVAAGLLAIVTAVLHRHRLELEPSERDLTLSTRLIFLPVVVILWGLTQETYETFRYFRTYLGEDWERAAQMGISLVWTLCGVLLLIGGVVRRYQPIRLAGLGLLGLTVTKVFLFDLGYLDAPHRILSFGGLGLALIGISWLYTRYGPQRA